MGNVHGVIVRAVRRDKNTPQRLGDIFLEARNVLFCTQQVVGFCCLCCCYHIPFFSLICFIRR